MRLKHSTARTVNESLWSIWESLPLFVKAPLGNFSEHCEISQKFIDSSSTDTTDLAGGEDVLHDAADPPDGEDVAEDEVPHDAVAELERRPLLLPLQHHQPVQLQAQRVRARQLSVLRPPPAQDGLREECCNESVLNTPNTIIFMTTYPR